MLAILVSEILLSVVDTWLHVSMISVQYQRIQSNPTGLNYLICERKAFFLICA